MTVSETLLEIREYGGVGYRPLVDYGEWRVAILRYDDELLPHNIREMQRHDETDEVFVLLSGRCILFLGEGGDGVTAIHAQDMQPLKLCNVKKGCWHSHTLSEDASVLIVENRDTTVHNSPRVDLTPAQRETICDLTRKLWQGAW
jgi:hypothetical protein